MLFLLDFNYLKIKHNTIRSPPACPKIPSIQQDICVLKAHTVWTRPGQEKMRMGILDLESHDFNLRYDRSTSPDHIKRRLEVPPADYEVFCIRAICADMKE